jgi:Uma2 family endonuclease
MTLEEYLSFEEQSPVKHEYVGGEVYAMSGVTTRHNLITLNLVGLLRIGSRGRGCRVFATDVKLRAPVDRFYYPDVIVACGKAGHVDLIIEHPSVLIEVTSRGTRATDRREKLESYRQIESLQTYLIVDQRRRHVLAYQRGPGGDWDREEVDGTDGEVAIHALGVRLTLDAIYDDVPLPPLGVREEDLEWGDD